MHFICFERRNVLRFVNFISRGSNVFEFVPLDLEYQNFPFAFPDSRLLHYNFLNRRFNFLEQRTLGVIFSVEFLPSPIS